MPRARPIQIRETAPKDAEQAATAAYVAALLSDLATLVRRQKLDTLGYLIDMARLEAEGTAHGAKGG